MRLVEILGERKEAYLHKSVKMVSFSRPRRYSAFHLFKSKFFGNYWRHLTDSFINTTSVLLSFVFEILIRRNFFWRLITKKLRISNVFIGQKGLILSPFFRVTLERAMLLHKLMGYYSVKRRAGTVFAKKSRVVFVKKSRKFSTFSKEV